MLPYVAPFLLFLVLIQIPSAFPGSYRWLYPLAVLLVGAVTWRLLRGRNLLHPHGRLLPGVVVGLLGVGLWIWLAGLGAERTLASYLPGWLHPTARVGFDPFEAFSHPLPRWAFITVRMAVLVVLVPLVEELFWRGFLLRYVISRDWQSRRVGEFTLGSFTVVTLLFALAHPEWLAAAVYCALLNGLLYWRRDLWDCIVAHSVSNLVLGIYVLTTGSWELW